jgi:type VI secretion system protein ImpA
MADWGPVRAAAEIVIGQHSKDLEAAAWMMEALLRTDGLRGLGAGARLITGLIDTFWGSLYPGVDPDEPDEDPAEACTRCISGLAGSDRATLLPPLRLLPLFMGADGTAVSLSTYDQATSGHGGEEGGPADAVAKLDHMAGEDPQGLAALAKDAPAVLEAWQGMEAALAGHAGQARPNTGEVATLLRRVADLARRLAPAAGEAAAADTAGEAAAPAAPAGAVAARPAAGGAPGPIASREDALKRLKEIADWFRRNEPHSPLAYTLDDAVRRGRMAMPDLLAEIVTDWSTRTAILTALGIQPPPEASE